MRFLNLNLGDRVPDSKTIWFFWEQLTKANLIEMLFAEFDTFLRSNGYTARKGQIVDASIISAPKQRNTIPVMKTRELNKAKFPKIGRPQK